MSRSRYRTLISTILILALDSLATVQLQAAAVDPTSGRQASLPGNLNRQIDYLVNLLRDGQGREVRGTRLVRLARLRDGTPAALVVFRLQHYRGANNRGEFLAAFVGDDALGRPPISVHYRLLGVVKTSEADGRIATDLALVGEDHGQMVIRLAAAEHRPGDPANAPSCRRSAEYRFKRELLYWSGEGAMAILPGHGACEE